MVTQTNHTLLADVNTTLKKYERNYKKLYESSKRAVKNLTLSFYTHISMKITPGDDEIM